MDTTDEITLPTRRTAAIAAAGISAIHLLLAPEYLAEQAYIGLLFIAGGLASAGVAVVLWRRQDPAAWLLGGLVAAGMAAGLLLSRTTGLPGFHESEWELSGFVSLLLEAVYLSAWALSARVALRPARTS
jgi:hypothetical protein